MKSILLALMLAAAPDAGTRLHRHCWHIATLQVDSVHVNEVCCHCGKERSVDIRGPRSKHGPFAPPEW